MTTVYNVTQYGARSQIKRQLEDLSNIPPDRLLEASTYIASKTFESIKKLFTAAKEIQVGLIKLAFKS